MSQHSTSNPTCQLRVHGMCTSSMPPVNACTGSCASRACMERAGTRQPALAGLPVGGCEFLAARGPVRLQVLRLQLLPQLPRQHGPHRLADKQQGPPTHVLLCNHTPAATWWHVGQNISLVRRGLAAAAAACGSATEVQTVVEYPAEGMMSREQAIRAWQPPEPCCHCC